MPCSKAVVEANRKVVAELFGRGDVDAAVYHRFAACCRASKCNMLCKYMFKPLGLRAFCVAGEGETERPEIRELLSDPEFKCPEKAF